MAKLEAKDYDIAVLDYHLPDGKGDDLLEAFRADGRQTICIMVTADPNPHLALNWMKKGAAAYLRKPFGPEYLVELCHKAMRERTLLNVETLLEQRTRKLRDSEAAFRAVTERLEMALQGADLGTWDWHIPDGTVVFNERWALMLGFALNEITPKVTSWEDRVHPDDLPTVMAELEAHLRGETPFYETEHRLRHKTGDWIWVLDKGRVFERDRALLLTLPKNRRFLTWKRYLGKLGAAQGSVRGRGPFSADMLPRKSHDTIPFVGPAHRSQTDVMIFGFQNPSPLLWWRRVHKP